jgi:hypothetical protein
MFDLRPFVRGLPSYCTRRALLCLAIILQLVQLSLRLLFHPFILVPHRFCHLLFLHRALDIRARSALM